MIYNPTKFIEVSDGEFSPCNDSGTSWMTFKAGDVRAWGEADEEGIKANIDLHQHMIDSGLPITVYVEPEPTDAELKLAGVEFEGVMCSATAEDQHGLADVEAVIRGGLNINFHFENGTKLLLTSLNIDDFRAVWFPFRLSFFE